MKKLVKRVLAPILNDQGELSGTRVIKLVPLGLLTGFLLRDLFNLTTFNTEHVAALSLAMAYGAILTMNSRAFQVKAGLFEITVDKNKHEISTD